MQYPDPELLAKRVALQRTSSGKVRAVFRHNERNPKSVWGKEVPYYLTDFMRTGVAPVLSFDNYVVPVALYLCALEATQDLPISASPFQIRFVADPHERVWTLLDKNVIGGASNQESMKSIQGTIIVKTYSRVKDEMPDAPIDAIVAEVANVMCRTRTLVRSVLEKAGIHLPEKTKADKQVADVKPHRFSSAYSFRNHFKFLSAIVQTCRSSVIQRRHKKGTSEPCSFSLADLDDRTALGGYPIRCPVLGVDLRWDEDVSWFSPRVGRYDPKGMFLSGNVVLMSKLAKRITEGLSVRNLETLIDQYPYMATAFVAWVAEHPVPSTPATNMLNSAPKVPLPPPPTLDEQKEKEQEYFKILDGKANTPEVLNSATPTPAKPLKELSVHDILGGNWDED
jgi:hypothetical protein